MAQLTKVADAEVRKAVQEYDDAIRRFAKDLASIHGASQATDQDVRDAVQEYRRRARRKRWVLGLFFTILTVIGSSVFGVAVLSLGAEHPTILGAQAQVGCGGISLRDPLK